MGWAVGLDPNWGRDIGYGVPAVCDQPGCGGDIDRGLAFVCGGEPYGGDGGCGLFFCYAHLQVDVDHPQSCDRCITGKPPHEPKADHPEWIAHKLNDPSWAAWRAEHPEFVSEHGAQA